MEFHQNYIREKIGQVGKKEGLNLLKEYISSSNDPIIRQEAIEIYGDIEEGRDFKFLEQLFLSDEDIDVRLIAGKILRQNYSKYKKLITLLEYVLKKGDNILQKIFAVKTLNSLGNNKAQKILLECLKDTIKENFNDNISQFPQEIFNLNYRLTLPNDFIEIFINLFLTNFYKRKCGYLVALRKGKIISLNCESSNLKNFSDIVGFHLLNDLEHLSLQRNHFKIIDGLDHLIKLKTLNLSHSELERIENLQSLRSLQELNLSNNRIKRIENLESLNNLKKLILNNNNIRLIENLDYLLNLEDLNLNHNQISEISNLERLTNLQRLNLSFNQIRVIKGLNKLINLRWLYLNDNKISKIEGLSTLFKLKGLYLSSNSIKKIENLGNLQNLKKIEISNNEIDIISGLDSLVELQELYLDNNNIKQLEGLNKLKSLIMVHLGRNKITKYRKEQVENLNNLNFLFLNENPLDEESLRQLKKRFKFP